jgi:hypothetical protein
MVRDAAASEKFALFCHRGEALRSLTISQS